jgi:hypothetical protein
MTAMIMLIKGKQALSSVHSRTAPPLFVGTILASRHNCRNIAISNNVGGVKRVSGTQRRVLENERHFALVDCLPRPTKGSLAIVAVKNSVRPNHLFDHNCDHDYYFELPCEGEREAQSFQR